MPYIRETALFKVWIVIAILAFVMFLHFISHLVSDAEGQNVGYGLHEDQFYDPTSTYDPVQRQMQEDSNRYFDELERQARESEQRERQFEMEMRLQELQNRLDRLENQ